MAHTLYAAATLLVPNGRMEYFERNWTATAKDRKTKEAMIKKVRAEWTTFYKKDGIQLPAKQPSIFEVQMGRIDGGEDDPFSKYINAPAVELPTQTDYHILDWWDKVGPPALRQWAYDLIAIPSTSCECERVFSGTKQLITPQTASLTDESIEQRECLRQWLKGGLVELQLL